MPSGPDCTYRTRCCFERALIDIHYEQNFPQAIPLCTKIMCIARFNADHMDCERGGLSRHLGVESSP